MGRAGRKLRAARRSRFAALIFVAIVAGLAGGGARGAFPGAAGKIAYTSTRLGGEQIFVASSDGSGETQLTGSVGAEGSVNAHPAWSPDGTRIVFDSNRNGGQGQEEIYVMNADGTGQTRVTNNSSSDMWPGFSPNGKKICFSSNRNGDYEIFTMNADGSAQRQITGNDVTDSRCSWSPAGTRIAYESASDVWTVRADGFAAMNLTEANEGFDGRPSWSPDGTQIVFDSVRGGASSIYRMTAGGAGQTDVTAGTTDINPDLSPDDARLAFERGSGTQQVYVGSSDGSDANQITPDEGSNTDAAWQPVRGPIVGSANCGITQDHSIEGITPTTITFDNQSGVPLKVYWLDYDGNRVFYNALEPGQSYDQPTWLTHPWVGLDSDGRCYGFTVSDDDSKTYVFEPFSADDTPPETTLVGVPPEGAVTTSSQASFAFVSSEPGSTFECSLNTADPADFVICPRRNGVYIVELEPGEQTLRARAIDLAGNVDPTPAIRKWTVLPGPPPNVTGQTTMASRSSSGAQGDSGSRFPSVSDDGNVVGFESDASNLTPAGNAGHLQGYVRDRAGSRTTLVSLGGRDPVGPANANSGWVQVSGNGNSAAFQSSATNLACHLNACPTTGTPSHIYVRDLTSDGLAMAIVDARTVPGGDIPLGVIGNLESQHPAISTNGQYIAFDSDSTNLGVADTNGVRDIYLRNLDVNSGLQRVSVADGVPGAEANGASSYPAMTGDGRYVAFVSSATNLVAADTNGHADVFVRDLEAGTTRLVSVANNGQQGNDDSSLGLPPSISADGRYVAFASKATNLGDGITVGTDHVYVRDLVAGTTEVVDVSSTGARADAQSTAPSLSDDGRYVTFESAASNLSPLVNGNTAHIYRHDLQSGTTNLVDLTPAGQPGGGFAHNGQFGTALSADGRYAVFFSNAADLISGNDTNESDDVFVRDFNAAAVVTSVTANLTTGSPSTEAVAKDLQIADFPLSLLSPPAQGTPAAAAPIDNFPIDNFPIDNFPIDNFPIDNFPIDNFPIDNFPIDNFPIDNFSFDAPSVAAALDAVPLSTIGIRYPGGWPAVEKGSQYDGVPPQGVSLGQLARANPASPALDPASTTPKLTFDQLDFSSSKLRHLGLEALAVGAVPLSSINPLGGGDALTDWCSALNSPPISCTPANKAATIGNQTVLGAALTGAPIDNFPIDNFPIDNFPIDNFPIDNMPIDNFPIDNMPLSVSPIDNFPIDNFNLAASGFGALRLVPMLQAGSPLGGIAVASLRNPNAVLTATTEATLGAAFAAGHVRVTATLADLAGSLGGFSLGDLRFYGSPPKTVHDLLAGLPTGTGFTFSDLLAIFITRAGVEWETLSTDTLASLGKNGRLAWHAGFRLEGTGAGVAPATVAVTLPLGWRYDAAAGASLAQGGASTPAGAPVQSNGGRTLTWSLNALSLAQDYSIDFFAYPGAALGPVAGTEHVQAATPTGPVQADDDAPVTVRQVFEPNDDPATAPIIPRNTEVDLSYIDSPSDVDFYRIPAPPAGDRLIVRMTNLPADYDLTLFAPVTSPLTSPGRDRRPAPGSAAARHRRRSDEHRRAARPRRAAGHQHRQPADRRAVDLPRHRPGGRDRDLAGRERLLRPRGLGLQRRVGAAALHAPGHEQGAGTARPMRSAQLPVRGPGRRRHACAGDPGEREHALPRQQEAARRHVRRDRRERRDDRARQPRDADDARRLRRRDPRRGVRQQRHALRRVGRRPVLAGSCERGRHSALRDGRLDPQHAFEPQVPRLRRRRRPDPVLPRARPDADREREGRGLDLHREPVLRRLRPREPAQRRPVSRHRPDPVRDAADLRARPRGRSPRRDAGADRRPDRAVRLVGRDPAPPDGLQLRLRLRLGRDAARLGQADGDGRRAEHPHADQQHVEPRDLPERALPGGRGLEHRPAERPLRPLPGAARGGEHHHRHERPDHDRGHRFPSARVHGQVDLHDRLPRRPAGLERDRGPDEPDPPRLGRGVRRPAGDLRGEHRLRARRHRHGRVLRAADGGLRRPLRRLSFDRPGVRAGEGRVLPGPGQLQRVRAEDDARGDALRPAVLRDRRRARSGERAAAGDPHPAWPRPGQLELDLARPVADRERSRQRPPLGRVRGRADLHAPHRRLRRLLHERRPGRHGNVPADRVPAVAPGDEDGRARALRVHRVSRARRTTRRGTRHC